MNAANELLAAGLTLSPDKAAYLFDGKALTYRGLYESAKRLGGLLTGLGVVPGDRVAIVLPDTPAHVTAFLGAILAGAVPVDVSTALPQPDYPYVLGDSGACALLCEDGHEALLEIPAGLRHVLVCDAHGPPGLADAPAGPEPYAATQDDLAFMLYTSGSTGRPKGVPHRHADLLFPDRSWGRVLDLGPEDIIFSASKLYFAYGLLASLALPLPRRATTVLYPGKPGAYEILDIIAARRPSVFFGVPTLYNMMLRALPDGPVTLSPRLYYSAGEPLPVPIFEEWKRRTGRAPVDGIGSTEAFNVFISNLPADPKPNAAGRAVPGFEARLCDDAGNVLESNGPGHLEIRGESTARSYWNRPEKTRETMLDDGWLRTGDVFARDGDYFVHQGRSDDMIKVGAHLVSPVRIENILLGHPGVAEAAVAAITVEGLSRPCAHIVVTPGTSPGPGLTRELRRFVKERLPVYMCPVRYVFADSLPKTPTGKIQRFKLRQTG